ncbi:hypothetical protein ACH5RR_027825 [Cinchona calisaya]|uniref:Uncharacterized protein n=1 Tax=Cinchona calisaya TaxID=153742 RepID=A0ABD2YLZ7_9GENT
MRMLTDPDSTLVVYMGLSTLHSLAIKLMWHGLPPDTLAVERGTTLRYKIDIGCCTFYIGMMLEYIPWSIPEIEGCHYMFKDYSHVMTYQCMELRNLN